MKRYELVTFRMDRKIACFLRAKAKNRFENSDLNAL